MLGTVPIPSVTHSSCPWRERERKNKYWQDGYIRITVACVPVFNSRSEVGCPGSWQLGNPSCWCPENQSDPCCFQLHGRSPYPLSWRLSTQLKHRPGGRAMMRTVWMSFPSLRRGCAGKVGKLWVRKGWRARGGSGGRRSFWKLYSPRLMGAWHTSSKR